jgi:hypothetical protein
MTPPESKLVTKVMLQIVASLTDNCIFVISDHNMFIVQAPGCILTHCEVRYKSALMLRWSSHGTLSEGTV